MLLVPAPGGSRQLTDRANVDCRIWRVAQLAVLRSALRQVGDLSMDVCTMSWRRTHPRLFSHAKVNPFSPKDFVMREDDAGMRYVFTQLFPVFSSRK